MRVGIMRGKGFLVFLMSGLFLTGCAGREQEAEIRFFGMDTDISITAYGKNAEEALTDAKDKVAELEGLWSVTDEGSDIYAVNHSRGRVVRIDGETGQLLSFALAMAEKTGGALEPTIYPVLTAWGFTTGENRIPGRDELEEILQKVGYRNVNLSGNEVILPGRTESSMAIF